MTEDRPTNTKCTGATGGTCDILSSAPHYVRTLHHCLGPQGRKKGVKPDTRQVRYRLHLDSCFYSRLLTTARREERRTIIFFVRFHHSSLKVKANPMFSKLPFGTTEARRILTSFFALLPPLPSLKKRRLLCNDEQHSARLILAKHLL